MISIINEAQSDGRYPAADTRFWAIATGNKDYLLWVKEQTKDKGTDAEDIKSFLPEGTPASNDAQPNTGVDSTGKTEDDSKSGSKDSSSDSTNI